MSESWTNLSVLVVGFGSIGRRHTRVLREIGVRDVRLCEPMPDRREAARAEFGVELSFESFEDGLASSPDTVLLCSPSAEHVPQARLAVSAGCHVLTEKPLSVSLDGIDELAAEASARGRIVMVAHCFRFHDGLLRVKHWLDSGEIGRLMSVRSVFGEYIPEVMPNYRNMYISQYSGVYELMHDIDLAIWFAGTRPLSVLGVDRQISDAQMTSPDIAEMLIEFEGRRMANVHLDFFQRPRHRVFELYGTEGTVTVEFARWDHCTVSLYRASAGEWLTEEMATDRDDMFRAEDREFLQAVSEGRPVALDISEGRKAIEVMLTAQESSRTGRAVAL